MTLLVRHEIGQSSPVMQGALGRASAPRDGWKPFLSALKNAYRTIRQAVAAPASFIFIAFLIHGHFVSARGWLDILGGSSASEGFLGGLSFAGLLGTGALLTASALWMAFAVWELHNLLRNSRPVRSSTFNTGMILLATSVTMLGFANI